MPEITLSPADVAALADAGAAGDAERVLAALTHVEVAEDERLEIGAGSPARRLLQAQVTVRAELLWPLRRTLCVAWLGPAGGLFAVPADTDSLALAEGPNWRVTQALSTVLRVGPRPRAAKRATLVTTQERLHALLELGPGADAGQAADALTLPGEPAGDDARELIALAAARPAHWRIEVRWGHRRRALHALDREETPLWLLAEWPGGVLIGGPSTPTMLWRGLSAMLPDDQEIEDEYTAWDEAIVGLGS